MHDRGHAGRRGREVVDMRIGGRPSGCGETGRCRVAGCQRRPLALYRVACGSHAVIGGMCKPTHGRRSHGGLGVRSIRCDGVAGRRCSAAESLSGCPLARGNLRVTCPRWAESHIEVFHQSSLDVPFGVVGWWSAGVEEASAHVTSHGDSGRRRFVPVIQHVQATRSLNLQFPEVPLLVLREVR